MNHTQDGTTLIELLVGLLISALLVIACAQLYAQTRQTFGDREAVARLHEVALFALNTIEHDLRRAGYFGGVSDVAWISGRATRDAANPTDVLAPENCGRAWPLRLAAPVAGTNNHYTLACPATGGAVLGSDVLTIRRTSMNIAAVDPARLQLQTDGLRAELTPGRASNGNSSALDAGAGLAQGPVHAYNLLVHSYYVAADSALHPGIPTLRRKRLGTYRGAPSIVDEEVMPGIENLQVMFGLDIDGDASVDRYAHPDDPALQALWAEREPPAVTVRTVRIWLLARSPLPTRNLDDNRRYTAADQSFGPFDDATRRVLLVTTVLLRNV